MNVGAGYRGAYSVLRNTLQTGDLLYIAGDTADDRDPRLAEGL